jgi:hypothetical protein
MTDEGTPILCFNAFLLTSFIENLPGGGSFVVGLYFFVQAIKFYQCIIKGL